MSLTSRIKYDPEFKNVLMSIKSSVKKFEQKNQNVSSKELLVPSNLTSGNASLIGTAFDYLARFNIAQFLDRNDVLVDLVSDKGLWIFEKHSELKLSSHYDTWRCEVSEFIKSKERVIPHNLYEISIKLAKLEHLYRSGDSKNIEQYINFFDKPISKELTLDLSRLMYVFQERFMIPEIINEDSQVIFNPNFGQSSRLVGGADADILIDGVLYDFKTTKSPNYNESDNLQLIGYYFLNELEILISSFLLTETPNTIEKLCIYKARFGLTEYFNVKTFLAEDSKIKGLLALIDYFINKPPQKSLKFLNLNELMSVLNNIRAELKELYIGMKITERIK